MSSLFSRFSQRFFGSWQKTRKKQKKNVCVSLFIFLINYRIQFHSVISLTNCMFTTIGWWMNMKSPHNPSYTLIQSKTTTRIIIVIVHLFIWGYNLIIINVFIDHEVLCLQCVYIQQYTYRTSAVHWKISQKWQAI